MQIHVFVNMISKKEKSVIQLNNCLIYYIISICSKLERNFWFLIKISNYCTKKESLKIVLLTIKPIASSN